QQHRVQFSIIHGLFLTESVQNEEKRLIRVNTFHNCVVEPVLAVVKKRTTSLLEREKFLHCIICSKKVVGINRSFNKSARPIHGLHWNSVTLCLKECKGYTRNR